jgi:hypothetical protein
MKKQQNQGWLKRSFVRLLAWRESPFAIVNSSWAMARKSILPTKANPAELAAFKNLSPVQRWEKVKRPEWDDEKLAKERAWCCLFTYILIGCSLMVFIGTILTVEYLNWMQLAGAGAYAGAALMGAARKSMRCYTIDNKQVILFEEWLNRPEIWFPTFNSKVFSDEKN